MKNELEFMWYYKKSSKQILRYFLKGEGVPRRFLNWVKNEGGEFFINDVPAKLHDMLSRGDTIKLIPPVESEKEVIPKDDIPIEIVYEDQDLLIINKPSGVLSIPASLKPNEVSMTQLIKNYYVQQGYSNQVVHVVTRLDRQTSGLMLVAKHRLAHAYLNEQIQSNQLRRIYLAISSRSDWPSHGTINKPIGRDLDSIIKRKIAETGKVAITHFKVLAKYKHGALLKLELETGRTHQIRVHLASCNGPIIGETLYSASTDSKDSKIERLALHCYSLVVEQPFTKKSITIKQPMPMDMQKWIRKEVF